MRKIQCMAFAAIISALFFVAPVSFASPGESQGKAVFEKKCGSCHGLDKARSKKKNEKEWLATVERMKKKGASLNDEETSAVVEYLAKNYGKK